MRKETINEFLETCSIKGSSEEFNNSMIDMVKSIENNSENQKEFEYYKSLSNKLRFNIYKLLEKQHLCTCAIAEIFNVSEGTVTHHLKILDKAGLIIGRTQGHFTIYYTKKNFLAEHA